MRYDRCTRREGIPWSKVGPCLEDVGQGKLPISFINRWRGSWFHTLLLSIRDIFWVRRSISLIGRLSTSESTEDAEKRGSTRDN
jgi:hypothetical protein